MAVAKVEDEKASRNSLYMGKSRSVNLESVSSSSVAEYTLRQLKRSFYTNVSSSFVNHIINNAVPTAGFELEKVKKIYHVKIFDKMRPDSTISCKCSVKQDFENLELYKDDEMHGIRSIISSAVLDPEVKGGLRWPLGKESGERYTVVGIWYTDAKAFTSSSARLKIRHADRFDFRSSVGEATEEVSLKLKGITAQLQSGRTRLEGKYYRWRNHREQSKAVVYDR
ncbi:hypothetical protein RJ639_042654 [Escallonia herrerae]|uniref:DUF7903 domain-containing protein n=1 Tax=Escallonia herrerae TaxID=1293975 RepID=A0AA89B6I7_9ASTE|nr:hypothetical protein RJ639_042654 [Escallonia herrerae]